MGFPEGRVEGVHFVVPDTTLKAVEDNINAN